jgi:hypothetical protein
MDFIHLPGETIVGFAGERGGDNSFYAGFARSIGQKSRINAVAGNDSERVWNFHDGTLPDGSLFLRDAETSTRDACAIHDAAGA